MSLRQSLHIVFFCFFCQPVAFSPGKKKKKQGLLNLAPQSIYAEIFNTCKYRNTSSFTQQEPGEPNSDERSIFLGISSAAQWLRLISPILKEKKVGGGGPTFILKKRFWYPLPTKTAVLFPFQIKRPHAQRRRAGIKNIPEMNSQTSSKKVNLPLVVAHPGPILKCHRINRDGVTTSLHHRCEIFGRRTTCRKGDFFFSPSSTFSGCFPLRHLAAVILPVRAGEPVQLRLR